MSKKSKKRKIVRASVKMSPNLSDREIIDILTAEEPGRERPEFCDNCGSHNSSLKKHGKEYWCTSCIKGETEEKKYE